MSLLQAIKKAEDNDQALGHFNIATLEQLKAISHVTEKYDAPVVIGTSEGERGFLGDHHTVDFIESYNKEYGKNGGYQLFLNADHTRDLEKIEAAAEAGYDSVIIDGANLPLEENIEKTKKAVVIAKSVNPNILVEGELGYIGKSSKLREDLPEGVSINPEDLPTPEEAKKFADKTGIDLLAPAVGNIHGMFKKAGNPDLQIDRIREIREAAGVPLVLHGGSGVSDEDFRAAIEAGISMVHVSTEIRVAWRETLEKTLKEKTDEIAPYRILPEVIEAMEDVVDSKMKLFMGE